MNPKKQEEILKEVHRFAEKYFKRNKISKNTLLVEIINPPIKKAILLAHNSCVDDVLEVWKDWIKKFEGCAVFSYLRGTDERIVNFNPSEKVWNKEFKESFTKRLKEMKQ